MLWAFTWVPGQAFRGVEAQATFRKVLAPAGSAGAGRPVKSFTKKTVAGVAAGLFDEFMLLLPHSGRYAPPTADSRIWMRLVTPSHSYHAYDEI